MNTNPAELDQVFQALSDATRRAVVCRLVEGPASVSELAEPFQMALPSFMQHLAVLEECGLARSKKIGRVRRYELAPKRLRLVEGWLEEQRLMWNKRLDRLDEHLLKMKEKP